MLSIVLNSDLRAQLTCRGVPLSHTFRDSEERNLFSGLPPMGALSVTMPTWRWTKWAKGIPSFTSVASFAFDREYFDGIVLP